MSRVLCELAGQVIAVLAADWLAGQGKKKTGARPVWF